MDRTTLVKVTNRNSGVTGYRIPEDNIKRTFFKGESKNIALGELEKLSYLPGGPVMLKDFLMIGDKNALEFLSIEIEPEYYYTEKEVRELLISGSLDALKDCLDFAPQGVIELIKEISVDISLPDTNKREAILAATGFSVNNAIQVKKIMNEDIDEKAPEKPVRRVATEESAAAPKRRTAPSYKVVE